MYGNHNADCHSFWKNDCGDYASLFSFEDSYFSQKYQTLKF